MKPELRNMIKATMFDITNPNVVNRILKDKRFGYIFNKNEILVLKIQSGQVVNYIGNLGLYNIKSLGNLKSVGGDLNLSSSKIQSLGNLKYVGGNLDLRYTTIQSLGSLESINGHLDLNNTEIQSLGNLKSVGNHLFLENSKIQSLINLKRIGGSLWLYNTLNLSWDSIPKHFWDKIIDKGGRPKQ